MLILGSGRFIDDWVPASRMRAAAGQPEAGPDAGTPKGAKKKEDAP